MSKRVLGSFVVASVFVLAISVSAQSEDKPGTHQGTVVKVEKDTLTMTGADKKEHSHTVPADAKVTRDGKDAKLADLSKGDTVRVTIAKKGDKNVITRIEAKKAASEGKKKG